MNRPGEHLKSSNFREDAQGDYFFSRTAGAVALAVALAVAFVALELLVAFKGPSDIIFSF